MSNKLDRSLQEIISSRPRKGTAKKGPSSGGRKASSGGISKRTRVPSGTTSTKRAGPFKQVSQQKQQQKPAGASFDGTSKVIVSNLPADINEQQIREYFGRVIAPTKSVAINFDRNGRSIGVATIVFKSKEGAEKAFKEFNGRSIDKTKRMKVEIVAPAGNPLDNLISKPVASSSRSARPSTSSHKRSAPPPRKAVQAGRKPVNKRNPRDKRPAKTSDQLDAEMEDYFASK